MPSPAERFGLMAYLVVMFGGLPDPELVSAAYEGYLRPEATPGRPDLRLIEGRGEAQPAERTASARARRTSNAA